MWSSEASESVGTRCRVCFLGVYMIMTFGDSVFVLSLLDLVALF